MNPSDAALYTVPDSVPVCSLDVLEAFNGLTPKERAYAHNIAMASWAGGFISLIQVSPEAPRIFACLTEMFVSCDAATLQSNCTAAGISDAHFNAFMQYAASFYGNLGIPPCSLSILPLGRFNILPGNYLSFGDTKFVPSVPPPVFESIVKASGSARAVELIAGVVDKVSLVSLSSLSATVTATL